MPKLIDHAQRQEEIAEAVWRVIRRDGVSAVSVRDVAAEAGISTGSLRHVFASKAELLAYSMRLVQKRVRERAEAHVAITDPWERALAVIAEFLPLDANRRCEVDVNLALVAESPAHPLLKDIALEAYRELRAGCVTVLTRLAERGLIRPALDIEAEAIRLHALIDGLAVHALIGDTSAAHTAESVIVQHLRTLA